MRSPLQPRGGYTALPNELLARAFAELTLEQLRLLVGLFYEAEFKRDGVTTPDGRWRVEFGQVLVSYSGLAERYGMTVDGVRWALRRFEDFGISARPALHPNETAIHHTDGRTKRHTNRPNVVDLGSWAAFLGERAANTKQDTNRSASDHPNQHAAIQHGNPETHPSAAPAGWPEVLAAHDRLPLNEQRSGIRDLDVLLRGGALVLRARDPFDADRLRDSWVPGIAKLAASALGPGVSVIVEVAALGPRLAAGGTR